MQPILRNHPDNTMAPWLLLLILVGYVLAALFALQFVGILIITPFFDFDLSMAMNALADPVNTPGARVPLLILQGITSLGAFVIVPLFVARKHLKIPVTDFFTLSREAFLPILLTVTLVFSFMVINSVVIEWNMGLTLPETLHGLESWMQSMEKNMERITRYLTAFTGFGYFSLAFLVIAVIPGIGEELLFRGLIQNLFNGAFKNPHIAIWLAAFLFGAFHFQFYGMVPRMLLGVLFGYLYYWSGHLGYAMIAHFINNGFMLLMLYLRDAQLISYNIEDQNATPGTSVLLLFLAINTALLVGYYRYFKKEKNGSMAKSI
ncbi:MAG: CPBP family intramembrane metalloprotease [Cyclobacteriaceae bacterium]|nr:CPBP family intramembrane metalloprotease [Cyclobacteriaceae bacterium]